MELYNRIKQRREELNLSQDDLAKRMGYRSRSTIAKIESGKNDIPQSKIAAFAKALETTPAYLMGLEERISVRLDMSNAKEHYANERMLLEHFKKLNKLGEKEAIKRIEELTYIPKYTENQEPLFIEIPGSVKVTPTVASLAAAHNRTDTPESAEEAQADLDMMSDDNF